ncbi:hypothetical protein FT662_03784, partial [Candidozyma haemuli var. vulneris]
MGEQILLQNFYLPTQDKNKQADIIDDTTIGFIRLREAYPTLQLIYGGDLNHSMEDSTPAEVRARLAIKDLDNTCNTEDLAVWDRRIADVPTNTSYLSNRRIDRFYFPRSWRLRARRYSTAKHPVITSTHVVISVRFHLHPQKDLHIGKPRFVFPLGRLLPPFSDKEVRRIPHDKTIDEAIFSIKSEAMDHLKFMSLVRRRQPEVANQLIKEGVHMSKAGHIDQSTKLFFQHKRTDPIVIQKLSNSEKQREAEDTLGMILIATDYYRELYQSPPTVEPEQMQRFLSPVGDNLSDSQRAALNRRFTQDELLQALRKMEKSSAPGPDGIQNSVLEHFWEDVGPILTREANNMMRTGKLPQSFKKVLITLIPKRDQNQSTEIANLRPISLTNTTLKVVSSAACNRLQKVLDKLIGPYQRGFIKGRHINHNTMEFFTMVQLIQDNREKTKASYYQAILMADFTKAFDRISHQYIQAVLEKMHIGTKMCRLLMSLLKGQFAQIRMNNCGGPHFPLDCGTRQGNPLSPLLFNIALEPLLLHLKLLEGIELSYGDIKLGRMQYHAFADDVNIYLANLRDYAHAAKCIKRFERASNSKVSASKSKLIGFRRDYPEQEQDILPYPQSYIKREELKYLGISMKGVNWRHFIYYLPFMTYKQGYRGLDIISKTIGTNMFVSSKTIYKDLVQCMTEKELRNIDDAIQRMFKGVSAPKLYARPKKGGYGLIELSSQLQGHRAKVLARTLGDDQSWFIKYLRAKMLHHVVKIFHNNRRAKIRQSHGLYWEEFLFEANGRYFENLEWTFTENEIQYIEAWKKLVKGTRTTHPATIASRVRVEDVESILGIPGHPRPHESQQLNTGIFTSRSRKKQ